MLNEKKLNFEKLIARARQRLGKLSYPGLEGEIFGRKNEVATKDAIRHFANGIGDPNPLWRNEAYARNTKYGAIIAPPTFINAILVGHGATWSGPVVGCEWEWFKTIHKDDAITVVDIPTEILDKTKSGGPKRYLEVGERIYRNQRDEIVAIGVRKWLCTKGLPMPDAIQKEPNTTETGRYKYSKEELETIDHAYEEEERRGANPRYWEDVTLGEELKPVVKGPITHADMVAFLIGLGWMDEAHGMGRALYKKFPEWTYTDPETGVTEWSHGAHLVDFIARSKGLSAPLAWGVQITCWLGHLMTNWMGDDGFLKKLDARFIKRTYHGDTFWCNGKVVKKYVEGNEHLVDCEIFGENQRGEITVPGQATAVLPSRALK
ncbi:MaoC family dehydratase N-terminal domain-containing protein [Chloroflexota bacterium]